MADSIYELDGHIIPGTAEEVEISKLVGHGRYFPPGAAVQIDSPIALSFKVNSLFGLVNPLTQ